MLQEDGRIITDNLPGRPDGGDPLADWLNYGHDVTTLVNRWQTLVNDIEREVRGRIAAAPAGPSRRKFPLPGKYNGKIGDPAATFLIQCENYFITEGTGWTGNYKIRWALQFLEDKAGPWAIQQLTRMETDLNAQGDPPRELRDWLRFKGFFATQFVDAGAVIQVKKKWRQAMTQTGSAKDYFAIMEPLIIKLGYDRDADHVVDQIFLGLKPHIRGHFATIEWTSFQEMKDAVVAYDEATFVQGPRKEGKKDFKGKGRKAPIAEASAVGTRRLSDQEWEMCKVKGLWQK